MPDSSTAKVDFLQGWCAVILAFSISAIVLGVVFALHIIGDVPVSDLTRDALAVAAKPPWFGFLSQAGIFFWGGAATICLFLWATANSLGSDRQLVRFGLCSALLTMLLWLYDAFMFHEFVFPLLFGLKENMLFGGYAALLLTYLFYFRDVIRRTDIRLLVFSLLLFATSVLADKGILAGVNSEMLYLIEDGGKFSGIVAWTGYFFVNTRVIVLTGKQS